MTTALTTTKVEKTNLSPAENQKRIDNHRKVAKHHEEAAKHHLDAAKHHEEGNHEKAYECALKAQGHLNHVGETLKEIAKHHVLHH